MKRLGLALILGSVLAVALAACGEDAAAPQTVVVEKEVIKEIEVPGETIIVTKEVPVEVVKEVVTFQTTEVIKEIKVPSKFGESPLLATLVRQGRLPPVDERLPLDPMVVPVVDSIGQYGGEIRKAYKGGNLSCNFGRPIRDGVVRPSMDGNSIVMAVAKSIEPSSDNKVFTTKLRTGMKWSDGMPFTADDFIYQFERVSDDELTPSKPLYIVVGKDLGTVRKIDDITVETSFDTSNGTFIDTLLVMDADCGRPGQAHRINYAPAHYMKQFYPKYAEGGLAAVEKMAKAAGFDDWKRFYRDRDTTQANPDRPTTRFLVLDSGITGKRVIGNRNPYFYAVDPVGNQLPYIDRWVWDKVQDKAAINLRAIAGEIDFQSRHIELMNVPLYNEHAEKGGYRVVLWPSLEENDAALALNISHQGPQGEYYRMADFRHALSFAIDKEKVNQIAFVGTGVVRNLMPPKGHPYYPGPELEFKYMEFDPQKAIEMLDKIMPNKNSDGFRLMSNGDPININIWSVSGFAEFPDIAEMIINDWAKVGIKGTNKANLGPGYGEAYRANTSDAHLKHYVASGLIFSYPDKLIPIYAGNVGWAPGYGQYNASDGANGVKPIPEVQKMIDLFYEGPSLPLEERYAAGRAIYAQHAEQQYVLNIVSHSPTTQGVHIVNEDLKNVPDKAANSWPHRTPSTGYPMQFFYAK